MSRLLKLYKFFLLLLVTTASAQNFVVDFLKYSTAYASFSLNAPKHMEDRFTVTGGLQSGDLEVERVDEEFEPDFQKSFGLRKIGRFKYEPKRGVKNAGNGGTWYDGSEAVAHENATVGPISGWEYLIKWTQGRQWGNEYLNQEYWLRYSANWWIGKIGYTELGLEEVEYSQADLRIKYSPPTFDEITFSIGLKHRQHPVYGFDAMILDTNWYKGSWWEFSNNTFGTSFQPWFVVDDEGAIPSGQLVHYDQDSESWVPVPGDGPFFNGEGEFLGYDYMWQDANGNIIAWTDREFFLYRFPSMLDRYIEKLTKDLGYQRETSLVLGTDYYHYSDKWWVHTWANFMPYHYGHDKYSYHNGAKYQEHLEKEMDPSTFMYMDPMWMSWNDYDFGAIVGVKLQDNLGIFAEGSYLNYWDRPAYDFKLGLNYQFIGF